MELFGISIKFGPLTTKPILDFEKEALGIIEGVVKGYHPATKLLTIVVEKVVGKVAEWLKEGEEFAIAQWNGEPVKEGAQIKYTLTPQGQENKAEVLSSISSSAWWNRCRKQAGDRCRNTAVFP